MSAEEEAYDIGRRWEPWISFLKRKLTDETAAKVWKHVDPENSGAIDRNAVLELVILNFITYDAYRRSKLSEEEKQIALPMKNKNKLSKSLSPFADFIKANKLNDNHLKFDEFVANFPKWVEEYYLTNVKKDD